MAVTKRWVIYLWLVLTLLGVSYPRFTRSLSPSFNGTLDFNRKQAVLTRSGFTQILYNYIDHNLDKLASSRVSVNCVDSLIHLNRSLENGDLWAFKMLDASGRAPIDLTGVGYIDMGNFDTCMQLDWESWTGSHEVGRYCLTSVVPDPPQPGTVADLFTSRKILSELDEGYSMKIGFCIPSSCSQNDLRIVLNNALEPFSWTVLRVDSCQISKSLVDKIWEASTFQKLSLALLTAFISLVIYSSLRDSPAPPTAKRNGLKSSLPPRQHHWINGFSVRANWSSLIKPDREMEKCPALSKCGLIQHIIVLLFHASIWPMVCNAMTLYAIGNPIIRLQESEHVRNLFGEWFMDGLFAYAGIAKSLELWSKINARTPFWRIITLIIRKMFILTCLFMILISVEVVVPIFSFGPFTSLIAERRAEICSKTYLANLLFLQNSIGSLDKVCVAHSWSLAAEYQLMIFLAALIWLYKRSTKLALSCNIVSILGGLLYVSHVFYSNNLSPHALARGFKPSILSTWTELVYLPAPMHFWLYISGPLWTYLVMNRESFSLFRNWNPNTVRTKLYLFGLFMVIYPYFWTSLLMSYESPLLIGVYILFYRVFTGLFYTLIIVHYSEQFKVFFGTVPTIPNIDEVNNNGLVNGDGIDTANGRFKSQIDVISPLIADKRSKFIPSKIEYQIIHILTVIFRSTYCIHISVMIWYYSQHKWPVITTAEWVFHLFGTVFMSIAAGVMFHFLVLGPFNHLAELFKRNSKGRNNFVDPCPTKSLKKE